MGKCRIHRWREKTGKGGWYRWHKGKINIRRYERRKYVLSLPLLLSSLLPSLSLLPLLSLFHFHLFSCVFLSFPLLPSPLLLFLCFMPPFLSSHLGVPHLLSFPLSIFSSPHFLSSHFFSSPSSSILIPSPLSSFPFLSSSSLFFPPSYPVLISSALFS